MSEDRSGSRDWFYADFAQWDAIARSFSQRLQDGKPVGFSWFCDEGEAGGVIRIAPDVSQITFVWSKNRVALPGTLRLTDFSWLIAKLEPAFVSLNETVSIMKVTCHDSLL